MIEIKHHHMNGEPWTTQAIPAGPRGEARDLPLSCLINAVSERGKALGVSKSELAGILGITEIEWSMFVNHGPDTGADESLETSLRLLCELFESVLAFAGNFAGAHWLRTRHPAMGDSPLGRLIRSSTALPWLSAVLFEERGA